MTLQDDILAVRNRTDLTDEQKQAAIYDIKANALATRATTLVGQTFTENGLRITITQAPVVSNGRLIVWVSATRNNIAVPIPAEALPFIFVNPPVFVRDVVGGSVESPLAALRTMVADTVSLFG